MEDGIAADHDHRIEHPLVERLGADAQATGGAQRAAVLRQHTDVIKCFAGAEVGVFEHRHGRQRHGLETFKNDKRHASHRQFLKVSCPENVL
ncbi:hypothetical protein D3C85_1472130 [compost metagenome]